MSTKAKSQESESKSVVSWKDKLSKDAQAVAKVERPQLSQISTRSGILSYMGTPVEGNALDCIILATVFENNLFKQAFDPNNPRNPDCYAMSVNGENMRPNEAVEEPENDNCETCPMHAWGSDPRPNSKGKACKEIRKMALLPMSALADEDAARNAEVAVLRIPVTSVRNWKRYVNEIGALHQRPPYAVVTTIAPRPHSKFQFEITFSTKELVSDDMLGLIYDRIGPITDILMQPYDKNPAAEPVKDSKKF